VKGTLDIHRALLAHDVPHEVIRLPMLVLAADELPAALGLPAQRCVVVRMYEADDNLAAVLVRPGDVPDPARLLTLLGARTLRAAPAERINADTEFAAGLVPPFLPALCDHAVTEADVVYTPTGESGTALGIPTRDLMAMTRATIATLCTREEPVVSLDELESLAGFPGPAEPVVSTHSRTA
jgi:prolyl-tRNA editing enzyme YbaK/EbsC (Cys-tRNA(Pro) deacylase)